MRKWDCLVLELADETASMHLGTIRIGLPRHIIHANARLAFYPRVKSQTRSGSGAKREPLVQMHGGLKG
jgi:hypothetical protein